MKIGVMTYWWPKDNYGQFLQCYALQKYLRDMGHDAYVIRYHMDYDYVIEKKPVGKKILKAFTPVKLCGYLYRKTQSVVAAFFTAQEKRKNEERKFEDFRNRHIKQSEKIYYSYYELKENPPQADVYIVGSDQVWNFNIYGSIEGQSRAYFLDFGSPSVKRISYAPSFGKKKLNDERINMITPLLQKFSYVSVREKSGLDICKACGINDAEWVPDPTMLLNADAYRELYKNEELRKPNKRYCFLYLVGHGRDFSVKKIYDWAKKKNLEIVYVSGNLRFDKYKKFYATVPEWIYLIEHAEYVITSSYHCSVFSLIFNKKFGLISLSKERTSTDARFDSLFEQFQLEKRFMNSDFSVIDKEINWRFVFEKFQSLRENCKLADVI